MEVGLVDIAAVRGYQRGPVTGGEAMGGMVEADELRGAFGCESDLGAEPGPQAFAAPAHLRRNLLDANLAPAGHHLLPGEGNLRVDRPAGVEAATERGLCDREPVVP